MNALFTFDFSQEKMNHIKNLGFKITLIKEKEIGNINNCNDFEVMVCNKPFNYVDIDRFQNLKLIQLVSSGVDGLPLKSLKNANIILTNCRGAYSIPIAEWTITKLLEIYKNSRKFYELQNNKIWEKFRVIYELNNKKACILGTGSIGIEIAKRLSIFGVEVTGINSTGKEIKYFNKCLQLEKINSVLNINDIVINTLPLTEVTINLINDDFIAKMKDKSVLINVSRGKILDEIALIRYLETGHLLGAALDVFELEPLPPSNPLWLLDNLIITPHVSYVSDMGEQRVFEIVFENLIRFKNGKDLINKVDYNKGY